jgi:hypothetical protein
MVNTSSPPNTSDGEANGGTTRELESSIRDHLVLKYGLLLDTKALVEVLVFPTDDALIRSWQRGNLTLTVVTLPHRRGLFALAHQVARYLVSHAAATEAVDLVETPTL